MEEMTEEQRLRFAKAVASRVVAMGSKRAVYQAADVSPQTLERVLEGKTVKGFTVAGLVNTLWPNSGGDWRRIYSIYRGEGPAPSGIHSPEDYFEMEIRLLRRRVEAIESVLLRSGTLDDTSRLQILAASDPMPGETHDETEEGETP